MLTFRSVMAEVSGKVGAGVYKLCPFKTNCAFLITSRPHVGVSGACFSLRILEKNNEEAHHTGKQILRTYSTLLLRCPAALIISRSHSSSKNSSLHTSKSAYYDILRVSPNATQAQIKTAYYRQSFRYHPDRNAGSDEAVRRFSEISEAYMVLGSVSLRRKYDRGVLSLADVQSAGRPSRKDTAHRPSPDHHHHHPHPHQRRSGTVPGAGGKPMFDFDAFYRAHYGEQLEREQILRRWREQRKQAQQEDVRKWKLEKGTEMAVGALLALGVVLLFSLKS
ncbi:dnaJ (Hsp40) homolog, subfamily C, member 30b [Pangasianodon hypophthalmus]|uniref:dnaJ (Hsp40) homolog, subfamily C, member 30b n=1 Tax=Pangasianodon hypophthalmus TaxID=310915 RepID=UPI0023074475|nr:dnaJ (Hsp40) homolog, subfamily C, member 30b [Pangasianodon hypophthalmus]